MAQEAALLTGAKEARKRVRTPGKHIIMWLFAPVAVVAIGAGLWLNMASNRAAVAALEYRTNGSGVEAAYFVLPDFLVDLSPDENGRTAYLKIKAAIALDHEQAKDSAVSIEAALPQVVERLTFFLRELRPEDFHGSAGMARVKREMARRVNLVIAPVVASDVVIEELVIQ